MFLQTFETVLEHRFQKFIQNVREKSEHKGVTTQKFQKVFLESISTISAK